MDNNEPRKAPWIWRLTWANKSLAYCAAKNRPASSAAGFPPPNTPLIIFVGAGLFAEGQSMSHSSLWLHGNFSESTHLRLSSLASSLRDSSKGFCSSGRPVWEKWGKAWNKATFEPICLGTGHAKNAEGIETCGVCMDCLSSADGQSPWISPYVILECWCRKESLPCGKTFTVLSYWSYTGLAILLLGCFTLLFMTSCGQVSETVHQHLENQICIAVLLWQDSHGQQNEFTV